MPCHSPILVPPPQGCRSRVLDVVDNLLEGLPEDGATSGAAMEVHETSTISASSPGQPTDSDVISLVLEPWLEQLLVALKTVVTAVWEGGPKQAQRVRRAGGCVSATWGVGLAGT